MTDANLFNDIVEKDYLCELHGEVVFVGARLQVADHRGSYTKRRHEEAGEDEVCRFPCLRIHQKQGDVFLGDPLEKVQDHKWVQVFLEKK